MEPIKIFLDTNIVLDFFTGRMNDGKAAKLVQLGSSPCYEMCISLLTAVNVLYVSRKLSSKLSPEDISTLFTILPQDAGQWDTASKLKMEDFEDAVQASCALASNCFCIVSRDRHYLDAPIPVLDPSDFLDTVVKALK